MKYNKIVYPDGQISAEILDITYPYVITERINSYEDLFLIKSLSEALDYKNIKNRHLKIPCLFGQRSDRRFSENNSFDLKIIADFINSCGFMDVEIFDPHSDVALALIHNSHKRSSLEFVRRVVEDVFPTNDGDLSKPESGYGDFVKASKKYKIEIKVIPQLFD